MWNGLTARKSVDDAGEDAGGNAGEDAEVEDAEIEAAN